MLPTASAAAAPANPQARSAITGEARLRHARRMATAVMLGRDFDVVVIQSAVPFLILDAQVREVHVVVEVRQVVFERPVADFLVGPVGVPVVVHAVAIPLMQPGLVFTLELMVEDDSFDPRAALVQALRGAFVGA